MDELRCIEPEAVAEVLELAPEHPVRQHARHCPRCRALLEGYRAFLAPAEPGPEHDLSHVDRRLDTFREELIGVSAHTVAEPAGESARPFAPAASRAPESWWSRLLQPGLRPAW